MGKLKSLYAELDQLRAFEDNIVRRVWTQSKVTTDLKGTPLTAENIRKRVDFLAEEITKTFPNAKPVIVGLLDGATPFASLLCEALNSKGYEYQYSPMSASSYGKELVSGEVTMGAMPKQKVYNRPVIIVDDVCDTGKTAKKIIDAFGAERPKSVSFIALVDKKQDRPQGCNPDYVGFTVPSHAFIVGLGLDYLGQLRNEAEIHSVDISSLPTKAEEEILAQKAGLEADIEAIIAEKKLARRSQAFFSSIPPAAAIAEKPSPMAPN